MSMGGFEVKRELVDWYDERQTTFAGVAVSPILNDGVISDINIPDSDMEITIMRSGGFQREFLTLTPEIVTISNEPLS